MSKVWIKEDIKNLLIDNDKALLRGIIAIYNFQTEEEKEIETTNYNNGIGYNGFDAEIMSSFAKQIILKGFLSKKQKEIARKKILKYSGQLTKIANKEL